MNYTLVIHTIDGQFYTASVAMLVDTVEARLEFIENHIDNTGTVLVLDETDANHAMFIVLNTITSYIWKRG